MAMVAAYVSGGIFPGPACPFGSTGFNGFALQDLLQ